MLWQASTCTEMPEFLRMSVQWLHAAGSQRQHFDLTECLLASFLTVALFYLHIFHVSTKQFLSTSPSVLMFQLQLRQVKSCC